MKTQTFERRPFDVQAVQVTPDNMAEIAKWCRGEVLENSDKGEQLSRKYITARTTNPRDKRQTQAYLGDWVVKSGNSFKFYTPSAFAKNFVLKKV